jgi:chromosome segregation ATPase
VKALEKPMENCKQCGKPLPQPKQKTPREREYCNDLCRKRANREKNAWKHNINKMKREWLESLYKHNDHEIHQATWMIDLEMKDHEIKMLKSEVETLGWEVETVKLHRNSLEMQVDSLKGQLETAENKVTNLEAETVRLNVLLEGQAKRKRHELRK